MAKSITARKSEVLRFIDTHGYALYCLINQINRNSSITNSHHIQKILEKAKIKSKEAQWKVMATSCLTFPLQSS